MTEEKRSLLEQGLLTAMRSLDAQVRKKVERRTPVEREAHGVGKFEPIEERVELVTSFLLQELGENTVELDSLIILARAFPKALAMVIDDLGLQGLGEVRADYCQRALTEIRTDVERVGGALHRESTIM